MGFKGREPATGFAIVLQVSFPALKGIDGNVPQKAHVAGGDARQALALLDWTDALPRDGPPLVGRSASFRETS